MLRFAQLLLLTAMMTAANLHLPFLQVVAWTGMLVSYSQGRTLAEAAEMTLDGEHPCPMCKSIKKQQEAARDSLKDLNLGPRFLPFIEAPVAWVQTTHWIATLATALTVPAWLPMPPERQPPR